MFCAASQGGRGCARALLVGALAGVLGIPVARSQSTTPAPAASTAQTPPPAGTTSEGSETDIGRESRAVQRYGRIVADGASRERLEDCSSALFIGFDKKVSARLWILDTIVTAAPLLGLLGTIFGIMETFNALAAGGVSDPAAVSRGIGTALIATAVGIATALLGLVGNNVLNRRAHVMTEDFKALLLGLTR